MHGIEAGRFSGRRDASSMQATCRIKLESPMQSPRLAPLSAALLLSGLLAACSPKPEQAAPAGAMAGMPPPEVEVITVARRTVARTVDIPGRLEAVRTAQVRARVEGILEKRLFREGGEVRQDEVLFQIDPRTLEANLASARASLAKAEAQALIARQNLDRKQALIGSNAVSRQEHEQAVAGKAQADAEVEALKAVLRRAEIDVSYAAVRAPIAGSIGRALVTEGALVGKGEATHLATIEQQDPIRVAFSQSSADFLRLREALRKGTAVASQAPVRLLLEAGREYARPGRILFNDVAVDTATGSVGMRAEFPNPGRELLPGQFVTVRLPVSQAADVIAVPQRSVLVSPQGQMVMVVGPDGKVAPVPVKTEALAGGDWIVAEGLQGGEQVIVNGVQKARPGMTVKAVTSDPKPVTSDKVTK
jgi:membrane fusion protein (multidrug efflux system)